MRVLQRASLLLSHKIIDLLALFLALAAAGTWTASVRGLDEFAAEGYLPRTSDLVLLGTLLAVWYVTLSLLWLRRANFAAGFGAEALESVKAASYSAVGLATLSLLVKSRLVTGAMLVCFWLTAFALLLGVRILARRLIGVWSRSEQNLRRVLVAGTGPRARHLAEVIGRQPEFGYRLLGFVDNQPAEGVIGRLDEVEHLLATQVVDELMIALPVKSFYNEICELLRVAEEQGISVHVHSDFFARTISQLTTEQLAELPLLSHHSGPQDDLRLLLKRAFDLAGAAALVFVLSPVMLLIALLIKLTSRGPVFFTQTRVGYNKRLFSMFKFRTMVPDAEARQAELETINEAQGPVFKIKHDPRITSIGHFLRKTSLDELPQLFNVLIGDLSLVGPRPLPVRDCQRFDANWLNRRFSVKPGITCIWQVSGRSKTTFEQWIKQDLEYIDRWTFLLDLKILLRTIPAVLRGDGAM